MNIMTSLSNTGYGIVGKNIALALHRLEESFSIFPFGNQIQANSDKEVEILRAAAMRSKDDFDVDAICLAVWHQFDLAKRVGRGPYMAYPFFEMDRLSKADIKHLQVPDFLVSPSEWAAAIIERDADRECYVINPGVDTEIFYPAKEREESRPYTFYNIGKWEVRKGHDIIPRLFDKAFEVEDDVELVMICHNPFLTPAQLAEWHNKYKNMKLASKVKIVGPQPTQHAIADKMRTYDCGLFPARAEGWNMEALESMACGNPVIITDYSAHKEYANNETAELVDIEDTEKAYDGKWFFGQGEWAELDYEQEEQIIEHMRRMYKERPYNTAGVRKAEELTWEKTAQKFLKIT